MPPFRMPFTSKRPTAPTDTPDENVRPNSVDGNVKSPYGKEKPSLALGIKEGKAEPNEFKLSCTPSTPKFPAKQFPRAKNFAAVNDSGEYLPVSARTTLLRDMARLTMR